MDTHRLDHLIDHPAGHCLPGMRFGLAGLSLRLAALRQSVERDYPLALAVDIVNRDAVDGLPPELTDTLHALLEEAVLNAARHGHAALAQLHVQVNGGMVLLSVADDGKGLPFICTYDLSALTALGAGPRRLMDRVTALGGSLTLDSRMTGTRIDIALPRDGTLHPPETASAHIVAA